MTNEQIRRVVSRIEEKIKDLHANYNPEVPLSEYDVIEGVLRETFGEAAEQQGLEQEHHFGHIFGSTTYKIPISRAAAYKASLLEKSPACNYCQHPENYPPGEFMRHTHTTVVKKHVGFPRSD